MRGFQVFRDCSKPRIAAIVATHRAAHKHATACGAVFPCELENLFFSPIFVPSIFLGTLFALTALQIDGVVDLFELVSHFAVILYAECNVKL